MNCTRIARGHFALLCTALSLALPRPLLARQTSGPAPQPAEHKDAAPPNQKQVDDLAKESAELKRRLELVEKKVGVSPESGKPAGNAGSPQEALDAALAKQGLSDTPTPSQSTSLSKEWRVNGPGGAAIHLIDVSFVTDIAAGWSSEKGPSLLDLQGGDHDPRRRGFTLQAAELGLAGAVDPYLTANANINMNFDPDTGETNVELEEAYATSQSLPWGLQAKAGQYFTEFGLANPTHPHTWDWLDQPIINTRLFTGDGMRGVGARLGWLMPTPWYSQMIVGIQNANGPQMGSFLGSEGFAEERSIGGRPYASNDVNNLGDLLYSARWENSFEASNTMTVKAGLSGAFGPNSSGSGASTRIYGADLKVRWRPTHNDRGWPFVTWQTEIMARDYGAAAFFDNSDPNNVIDLSASTLHDWGLYSQVLYGFEPGWAVGLRYDFATGSGESVGGRSNDPYRDTRHRISPMIEYQVSEFSRLRVQYNHDILDHVGSGHADSLFFGFEFLFGAHPAHTF